MNDYSFLAKDAPGWYFEIKAKYERIKALEDLLRELSGMRECSYDWKGFCQTHAGRVRPCPHERARELLK